MNERYTYEQAFEAALKYFNGDTLAASVWVGKYALKSGEYYLELSPKDMFKRLVNELHRAESKYDSKISIEDIQSNIEDFNTSILGGSILFGLGNNEQVSSLGNCFFVDNEADSYGGIFNLDETIGQLMKRRGGVGVTIEHLRPAKSKVNNSAQTSTGATSFMNRYSTTTREVAQDGRRGALMISCHIDHPDSPDFIVKKDDQTSITGANISVKVTDRFMKAVENEEDYILHWPIQKNLPEIDMQSLPYNKLVEAGNLSVKKVKAKDVWNSIIKQAHKNAEPGVLFWDTIINESPADCYASYGFTTKGTNPCGEVPLSSHDSCRLASLVLNKMVLNPYTIDAEVDYEKLEKSTRFLQRMMDNIVELEEEKVKNIINKINLDKEPEYVKRNERETWEKILKILKNGRRTGLGVLGLGDMLAQLGIKYGSKQATELIDKIFRIIAVSSYKESVQLAKERGCFPLWSLELEKDNPFIQRVIYDNFTPEEIADYEKYGRRNIANLSLAPTGSLAIKVQTTSGIEPVYKIRLVRRKKINPNDINTKVDYVDDNGDSWQEYSVFHRGFLEWYKSNFAGAHKFKDDQEIEEYLNTIDESELSAIISKSPWSGAESHSIDYIEKVNMQGVIQKWVDHAISVTHNLPEKITISEVNDIYLQAWKKGCKGCTVYREGSRSGVLLSKKTDTTPDFVEHNAPKRPKELAADYYYATSQGRKFAVIVGLYKDKPYEIFAFENPSITENHKGKIIKVKQGEYKFVGEKGEIQRLELAAEHLTERAHTILLSMLLRHGAPLNHIIKVATKIDDNITSFSSVCRRVLSKYLPPEVQEEKCPSCGTGNIIREEGCLHCDSCEYSKC